MLELRNIKKIFNQNTVNETTVFDNFNLSVKKGDFVSVIGSNGSGKTTMLNIICGSLPIEGGEIIIGDRNLTGQKEYKRYKNIGRVYQNPSLGTCPSMTLLENMSLADNKGKIYGLGRGTDKKRINYYKQLLSRLNLGLEDKLYVKVGLLSGGQRQAVALLMSTMTPIDFLILDEHTAALDPKTAEVIMQLTRELVIEKKITAIMVTHNLKYAVEYGNRLIMMCDGKAIIDKSGKEKEEISVDDILDTFNKISIEKGN